ncbi:hypothetical protein [Streptomyces roseolus]|uniref:hypothetical protein n=1 Tax=Streptomyces roseolus TaxID=67358 RepID=UPI0016719CFA|nr:hypothetical protein [Streptomyces roseolus]GGR51838.1 hypothetical protein GCM10010282_50970 [Streptomyces roseolus]
MKYRTLWTVRHVMHDDRLAQVKIDIDEGVIALALRYGHIHPALARQMAIFSQAFAEIGPFELDPGHMTQRPELLVWFERVDKRFTDGEPMRMYFGGRGPWFFEILVRDDLVDEALVREMNDVMPTACGLLVPARLAALSASRPGRRPSSGFGTSPPCRPARPCTWGSVRVRPSSASPRTGSRRTRRACAASGRRYTSRFPFSYSATHSDMG